MYLFQYKEEEYVERIVMEALHKRELSVSEFERGIDINSTLYITSRSGLRVLLSEFPGNCSSLILSNVQSGLEDYTDTYTKILEAAIEITQVMKYAALFITGTSSTMRKFLEDNYQFKCVVDQLYNPHSGKENFFLMKEFTHS